MYSFEEFRDSVIDFIQRTYHCGHYCNDIGEDLRFTNNQVIPKDVLNDIYKGINSNIDLYDALIEIEGYCDIHWTLPFTDEDLPFSDDLFDDVSQPKHYTDGKYECIEVMEDVFGVGAVRDFCICNAFKYLWRHRKKNGIEDIRKAQWYLDKYVDLS